MLFSNLCLLQPSDALFQTLDGVTCHWCSAPNQFLQMFVIITAGPLSLHLFDVRIFRTVKYRTAIKTTFFSILWDEVFTKHSLLGSQLEGHNALCAFLLALTGEMEAVQTCYIRVPEAVRKRTWLFSFHAASAIYLANKDRCSIIGKVFGNRGREGLWIVVF